ncbi:uncharacterized protein TRIADDRAFT_60899 [Trichoplax adhaerens]|uniref:Uncharacterized protein n=1 Tax=Trichoplax adhaerens TaxID=10228 RepID=B3S9G5_TRIAD|nr:predicted protein [Trichoplax adhaerens]EDV20644.1 predicted protein [Trichoplax adhaerens]|eukprot:XP_002116844.1 predicted protein [Trichoplax adhaerens]
MLLSLCCVISLLTAISSASNGTDCLQTCYLHVNHQEITYLQFSRTINDGATRVVYFDILRDHYYNVNATLYAWVRDNVGEPVFSLPIDYIATSFSLPMVFIDYVQVEFNESTPRCYMQSSQFCQKIMIMSALAKMTRLDNRCNGTNCGSLCRRHFHFRDQGDLEHNTYSCCPENSLEKQVDLVKCLQPQQLKPYIPLLRSFTIILGSLISCTVLSAIANRVIKSLGSTITVQSNSSPSVEDNGVKESALRKMYILSPITRQTSMFNYFKNLMSENQSLQRMHYICYTAIGHNPSSKQYHYKSRHVRSYYQNSILNYVDIWHPVQFISQFIRIQMFQRDPSLSNINRSNIIFIMSWMHGFITIASIFISLQCIFRMIISASSFIVAYSLYFSNIITITIPFIYYIYITIDAYINRMDKLCGDITATLPQVENELTSILEADEGEIEIYFKIDQDQKVVKYTKTRKENDKTNGDANITASNRELQVLITDTSSSPKPHLLSMLEDSGDNDKLFADETDGLHDRGLINELHQAAIGHIDVPEMLIPHKEEIQKKLQQIFDSGTIQFDKGTYKIFFHYIRNDNNKVQVDLPPWNDHHLYKGCIIDLKPLANQIEEYLQNWNIEQFKQNLVKVYDRLGYIDEVECVAIPEGLFNWIRYYSPELSFTVWSVVWKITVSSGIYAALLLAIPAYSHIDSFAGFNAAITKLPVSLVTIIIALKCFQESTVDQEIARKMLLSYLIRYRRGYQFFHEQGNNPGIFSLLGNFIASFSHSRKARQYIRLRMGSHHDISI